MYAWQWALEKVAYWLLPWKLARQVGFGPLALVNRQPGAGGKGIIALEYALENYTGKRQFGVEGCQNDLNAL